MDRVTYQDLVVRYGNIQAFDLLMTIEKLARIKADIIYLDEEERLKRALEALNAIDFSENTNSHQSVA